MKDRLTNLSNGAVLGILIGVALASSLLSAVVNTASQVDTPAAWWVSWLQNFSTEMFGAFLTFVLIGLIVGGREKRHESEREIESLKARLVRELSSRDNGTALRAAEELRAQGWLTDGTLRNASLVGANLRGALLRGADLRDANLAEADLTDADLSQSHLQGARLTAASLQRADLTAAHLEGAWLLGADLNSADLSGAHLEGANLWGADMQGARLAGAHFDAEIFLPDRSLWTPQTDMRRFTDGTRPDFWRADNAGTPTLSAR